MSKRKTIIELQSKPENKAVRRIIEKTKPVEFAPINLQISKTRLDNESNKSKVKSVAKSENESKRFTF